MTGPPPKSPLFPSPPLSRPHAPPLVRREDWGRRGGQPGERIAQRGHALDAGEPLRHEPIQYRGGDLQLVDEVARRRRPAQRLERLVGRAASRRPPKRLLALE